MRAVKRTGERRKRCQGVCYNPVTIAQLNAQTAYLTRGLFGSAKAENVPWRYRQVGDTAVALNRPEHLTPCSRKLLQCKELQEAILTEQNDNIAYKVVAQQEVTIYNRPGGLKKTPLTRGRARTHGRARTRDGTFFAVFGKIGCKPLRGKGLQAVSSRAIVFEGRLYKC